MPVRIWPLRLGALPRMTTDAPHGNRSWIRRPDPLPSAEFEPTLRTSSLANVRFEPVPIPPSPAVTVARKGNPRTAPPSMVRDVAPPYWMPFGNHTAVIFQLIFWTVAWILIAVLVGFDGTAYHVHEL